ncbi:hypothetical protein I4U23_001367 [Adineta vaga]|nr:hypothetical protein I4U23_001367 [Adineta vaga]
MFLVVLLGIIYYFSYRLYQYLRPSPNINPNGKYVLISGCDSGFGHGLALELDKQGFHVVAGVFLPESIVSLKNKLSPKATVFRLDITKQEDIDAAFELITSKTKVLHALVNNAGIADGYLIDWTSMEVMRKVMNINLFGHIAMTKTFLPLLIVKRYSRVINVSSISGYVSFAGTSAISSANHALEAFSDCLRREMMPWNLYVSIIQPGAMRTAFIENISDRIRNSWTELSTDIQNSYGNNFLNNTILQVKNSSIIVGADNPRKVIVAIQHAVSNTNPAIRYRPGWQSNLFFFLSYICPTQVMDYLLNLGETVTPISVRNQIIE